MSNKMRNTRARVWIKELWKLFNPTLSWQMAKLSLKQVNWFFQIVQLDKGTIKSKNEFSVGQCIPTDSVA